MKIISQKRIEPYAEINEKIFEFCEKIYDDTEQIVNAFINLLAVVTLEKRKENLIIIWESNGSTRHDKVLNMLAYELNLPLIFPGDLDECKIYDESDKI